MGDSGSMLIGLLLAAASISLTGSFPVQDDGVTLLPALLPLFLPLAVIALPFTDLLLQSLRRTRAGRSPFAPDKQHLHHRLLEIGHSHGRMVFIMGVGRAARVRCGRHRAGRWRMDRPGGDRPGPGDHGNVYDRASEGSAGPQPLIGPPGVRGSRAHVIARWATVLVGLACAGIAWLVAGTSGLPAALVAIPLVVGFF